LERPLKKAPTPSTVHCHTVRFIAAESCGLPDRVAMGFWQSSPSPKPLLTPTASVL
jgi:hypothetical protein